MLLAQVPPWVRPTLAFGLLPLRYQPGPTFLSSPCAAVVVSSVCLGQWGLGCHGIVLPGDFCCNQGGTAMVLLTADGEEVVLQDEAEQCRDTKDIPRHSPSKHHPPAGKQGRKEDPAQLQPAPNRQMGCVAQVGTQAALSLHEGRKRQWQS